MMETRKKSRLASYILCALFAALIAVGAFLRIPIPVIPFTLQVLFTTLAGLLLGAKLGALSAGLYVAVGLIGIPIFTQGGGPGYIFQPTFGYLIGFIIGTFVTGKIVDRAEELSIKRLLCASYAGLGIIYAFGVVYYYFLANYYMNSPIGVGAVLLQCFLMTIPGDIVLCFVAALLAKRLIPILRIIR